MYLIEIKYNEVDWKNLNPHRCLEIECYSYNIRMKCFLFDPILKNRQELRSVLEKKEKELLEKEQRIQYLESQLVCIIKRFND